MWLLWRLQSRGIGVQGWQCGKTCLWETQGSSKCHCIAWTTMASEWHLSMELFLFLAFTFTLSLLCLAPMWRLMLHWWWCWEGHHGWHLTHCNRYLKVNVIWTLSKEQLDMTSVNSQIEVIVGLDLEKVCTIMVHFALKSCKGTMEWTSRLWLTICSRKWMAFLCAFSCSLLLLAKLMVRGSSNRSPRQSREWSSLNMTDTPCLGQLQNWAQHQKFHEWLSTYRGSVQTYIFILWWHWMSSARTPKFTNSWFVILLSVDSMGRLCCSRATCETRSNGCGSRG